MKKNWEVFTQKSNRVSNAPRISVNKRALFSLNQKAFELLDGTSHVEFLFDKGNKLIGLRPSSSKVQHAYQIKKQSKSHSYLIRGAAFWNAHGLGLNTTVVFDNPAVDEDGVLVLNVDKVTEVAKRKPKVSLIQTPPEPPKKHLIEVPE